LEKITVLWFEYVDRLLTGFDNLDYSKALLCLGKFNPKGTVRYFKS